MTHYKNSIKEPACPVCGTVGRPEFIIRNGRPTAVILGIREYREILERLEDIEDLAELKRIRKNKPQFRRIEDFLK